MHNAARACAALLLALAPPAIAQQSAPPAPGYVMPDTETWDMTSAAGETYRIFVSRPSGPPPADGLPVLYVLDGNALFAGFAEARRIQQERTPAIGQSIVVGIGYPTDKAYDTVRRTRDFTPALPTPRPITQPGMAPEAAGGNDRFLAFLLERVMPEIARRYRVDTSRQSLFGHSLGGLLALHALYTRPNAFQAVVAASPSLWWNDQGLLAEERAFATRLAAGKLPRPPARLMVLVGENEQRYTNYIDAIALAKRMEPLSAYGLRSRFAILDGEDHMTVPSRAVTTTLRFVHAWP